jgi:hypothetical protein
MKKNRVLGFSLILAAAVIISGCTSGSETIIDAQTGGVDTQPVPVYDEPQTPAVSDPYGCESQLLSAQMRDGCYMEAAKSNEDSSLCEKIADPELQSLCMGYTTLQTSYCDSLASDYQKYQCYSWIAEKTQNPSVCDAIDALDAPAWKQACLSGI